MPENTSTTLTSPDGRREYTPADRTEATNLAARGWTPKADAAPKPAPKTPNK